MKALDSVDEPAAVARLRTGKVLVAEDSPEKRSLHEQHVLEPRERAPAAVYERLHGRLGLQVEAFLLLVICVAAGGEERGVLVGGGVVGVGEVGKVGSESG